MTFWHENYGFVKEVYDFRLLKYQEWMDNLEAIVAKVMAPNVQYTYKEFKIMQDTLASLTRDLEKEGMKEWLDLMLEKVAMRVADDSTGPSSRDKEFKAAEKKRLTALIERHDKLLPSTIETQAKVEIYARCYSYGDDISATLKTLEEMRHLSVKEIHPHNMNMVEEQIEKADKNILTVEAQRDQYEEYIKRGQKLLKNPNCAPFLAVLIEKLETTWNEANSQSKIRLEMLQNSAKDWEKYDEMRSAINEPIEKLESEIKKYRKFFDPVMASKRLASRFDTLEQNKAKADDMFESIKKCYNTIIVLAGDDKKEFLDKEVSECEDKRKIITACQEKLGKLKDYNDKLHDATNRSKALGDWASPANHELNEIVKSEDLSPEDRTKAILALQEISNTKAPLIDPLSDDFKALISEEDMEKSETAKKAIEDWKEVKEFVTEVCQAIDTESGSITTDQRYYADYLYGVKEIKPWFEESETATKKALVKPPTFDDCTALFDSVKVFDVSCVASKGKLQACADARSAMEKPSNTENEVDTLTPRWEVVKKVAEERVAKVEVLLTTWTELRATTEDLAAKMAEVPKQEEPNLEELEKVFVTMKELFAKKKELLAAV